ncbi:putative UDP-rhamnose:rhamnosyltransferase 1 [Telopea speciosissima]|uniref:putative UDP-rhamnose:rhamnosyltransferase 1 n=1 Tax=Telopea speciosissima TaxID=54955 RepID=UPI001CC67EC6|nr:putative UDP-rhamnose:rhamnosyltransferase 1 [Telopea speciosissima]
MAKEENMHVVMLPWSAFGHLIPFLHLSIALAKAGIRVSFVSTPSNLRRLPTHLIPTHLPAPLDLVELQLPPVDGLPSGGEATVDISVDQIQYLKTAYDLLKPQLKQFISQDTPDWIIQDFCPRWTDEISRELNLNIPLILFSVYSATLFAFLGPPEYLTGDAQTKYWPSFESLTSPPEWVTFPSTVACRPFEAGPIHAGIFGRNASGISDVERFVIGVTSCKAIAIRSCKEYEGDYLALIEKVHRRPVIPVGLLPPAAPSSEKESFQGGEWLTIFKWLDQQPPKSIVFVGFGSECKLSREHVFEIAHGLEIFGLSFLWALRKPMWAYDDDDALPPEFRARTEGRGVVCMGWAPQMEILAHPSVGGSLFHSGWGSIIETLQFGHTIVVLPMVADQGLNARLLVEKGLAVEVERGEDGSFDRKGIAEALRKAMVDEEGEGLRLRAREMKTIFGDHRLHQAYMDGFIQYLKNGPKDNTP